LIGRQWRLVQTIRRPHSAHCPSIAIRILTTYDHSPIVKSTISRYAIDSKSLLRLDELRLGSTFSISGPTSRHHRGYRDN